MPMDETRLHSGLLPFCQSTLCTAGNGNVASESFSETSNKESWTFLCRYGKIKADWSLTRNRNCYASFLYSNLNALRIPFTFCLSSFVCASRPSTPPPAPFYQIFSFHFQFTLEKWKRWLLELNFTLWGCGSMPIYYTLPHALAFLGGKNWMECF